MSDSSSSSINSEPDKNSLWGWWREGNAWQPQLHKRASYKALDIPEEMGDIQANKSIVSGIGWKELAVLGALGIGGYQVTQNNTNTATPPPAPPAAVAGELPDSEYEVRFFDRNGNPIDVPNISQFRAQPDAAP
jgi:hypothetical protein